MIIFSLLLCYGFRRAQIIECRYLASTNKKILIESSKNNVDGNSFLRGFVLLSDRVNVKY